MNATKLLLFLGLLLSSLMQDSLSPVIHASVSTKKKNGKVEIKVSDNGNGILKMYYIRSFNHPYYQDNRTGNRVRFIIKL